MPIRPVDIRRREFNNGFRGYNPDQVDDFLDAVADEFERTYTENQRMREDTSGLRERLQQFEDLEGSIRAALVHAEKAANDVRESAVREAEDQRMSARREAENLRAEARREADFIIREAQSRSHQLLADSSARVERVQDSYEALKEAKKRFSDDFRHLLKAHLDMMDNVDVTSARDIEAALRERLDLESLAVAREAAREREAGVGTSQPLDAGEPDGDRTVSGHRLVEPGESAEGIDDPGMTQPIVFGHEEATLDQSGQETEVLRPVEAQAEQSRAEESPTEDPWGAGPLAEGPLAEEPREEESGTESFAAEDETTRHEAAASEPGASEEVEREETLLAEDSESHEFFDKENTTGEGRGDGRIFRASRFLRRRE